MSAREDIAAHFTSDTLAEQLLNAYRAEVLTEAKVETVAWLVKKVREYRATGGHQHALQADAIATLASKVDRGAVRAFLGTSHYRDAMDAHRAEVLAEDGQAYPSELAMLHGLIATLRAVAEHGDLNDVRKLLEEHQTDHAAARAETHTVPAGPTGRVAQLLDAIRTARGRWTTVTAFRFYRDHIRSLDHIPNTQLRAVARGDLRDHTTWGHLARHEEPGRQYYTLKTRKDGAS